MTSVVHEELAPPYIKPGIYQHYKGKKYEVIGVGLDTETLEPFVVYKPLYDSKVKYWVRPYDMFTGSIVVDNIEKPRFTKLV